MIHRTKVIAAVLSFADAPAPAMAVLSGFPRSGKSHLLRTALGERPSVWLAGSRLPAPLMAAEMEQALREQLQGRLAPAETGPTPRSPSPTPWTGAFGWVRAMARLPHPPALVLDGADALLSDRRFVREMESLAAELRSHGRQLRILAAVSDPGLPSAIGLPADGEGTAFGLDAVHIPVPALSLREAAARVEAWTPEEVITAFALVGGLPDFWSRVDPSLRPVTNLARLLLTPDAVLRDLPWRLVPEGTVRSERSLALIRALAHGARSWGELRSGAAVFRSSSELGPYVKGLVEAGLVEVSTSLDAGPRSRNRRYRLAHPLLAFWHACVHPRIPELDGGGAPQRILADRMGPELSRLVARSLPDMVRRYLLEHGGERLPAPAREVGAVWGSGYDMEVAGTLASGAPVYGHIHWDGPPPPEALDTLGAEIRATRYGFGRESRLSLLLLREDPPHGLARRAAQLPGAFLLGPRDLVGRG